MALVVAFYYVVLIGFNVIYYTFAVLFRVMPFVLIILGLGHFMGYSVVFPI